MFRRISKKIFLQTSHQNIVKIPTCYLSNAKGDEVQIPVPWGHVAGKWWGPKDKQPILTFHGWQDNCGSFSLLLPMLPKHYSFLALDFPGHGLSSKIPPGIYYHSMNGVMLIRRLQAYFNMKKISLIGHSLGAITSYTYGGFYPESVNFMICIDGLMPLMNPKKLSIVPESIDKFLKYDSYVVSNLSGKVEPPTYSMETMIEILHKGTRGSIDKDKCKYIIERNVKKSKLKPGLFYFDRDPRLKSGPLLNWSKENLIDHALRVNFPLLATKADESPVSSNHQLITEIWQYIAKNNTNAEFHKVKGKHHGHLNNPELYADIITRFIEKNAKQNEDIDTKVFESIKWHCFYVEILGSLEINQLSTAELLFGLVKLLEFRLQFTNSCSKMSFQATVYNALFRRSSGFALVICASAFFFERTFELSSEAFFKNYNKGKLFEDIKSGE